ncbi:Aste57867_20358 [Aphanomyces stellatus]|uniref:Aste57867_20358 protein n=1 Tax=Aphanomyces stellatus TaxID=120398 RepID=A0A485LEX6_9STRA|nr:hypothetical protein As57867_020292 [Aphanomyces stellatus]VFT97045.1 Aste57867_20358 [Aphanomyces stellatus]
MRMGDQAPMFLDFPTNTPSNALSRHHELMSKETWVSAVRGNATQQFLWADSEKNLVDVTDSTTIPSFVRHSIVGGTDMCLFTAAEKDAQGITTVSSWRMQLTPLSRHIEPMMQSHKAMNELISARTRLPSAGIKQTLSSPIPHAQLARIAMMTVASKAGGHASVVAALFHMYNAASTMLPLSPCSNAAIGTTMSALLRQHIRKTKVTFDLHVNGWIRPRTHWSPMLLCTNASFLH